MKLSTWAKVSLFLPLVGILSLGISLMVKFDSVAWLIIALLFVVISVIAGIVLINKEKKERFCSDCGRAYTLDDVEYEEKDRVVKTYKYNPDKGDHQIEERLTYKVGFNCSCPQCGAKKSYIKTLDGGVSYYDGDIKLKNPEETIRDYFSTSTLSFNQKKSIALGIVMSVVCFILTAIISVLDFSGLSGVFGDVGSRIDSSNYYGTYYAVDKSYTEYQLIVSDGETTLKTNEFFSGGGIEKESGENQVFYDAEYMQEHYPNSDFEGCPALVFGSISKKIFWVTKDQGGEIELSAVMGDGYVLTFTTEEVNRKILTNDPENYYGTYTYAGNSVRLTQDGGAYLNLSPYSGTYRFVYASGSMLSWLNITGYSSAIVVIVDQYNYNYIWFGINNSGLSLKGQYTFVKD